MKTLDEIEKMFIEMGLGTEEERTYYLGLSQLGQESKESVKPLFTITTTNTLPIKESQNGKLE